MEKVTSFYQLKELEIYGDVSDFLKDEEAFDEEARDTVDENGGLDSSEYGPSRPRPGSMFRSFGGRPRRLSTLSRSADGGIEDSDDEDDESAVLNRQKHTGAKRTKSTPYDHNIGNAEDLRASVTDLRTSTEFTKSVRRGSQAGYDDYAEQAFNSMYSSGITLKKRAISLYVQLCELKSFVQLNRTGFKKVLKKYDKILDRSLKSKYLDLVVDPAYPFKPETTKHIEENIEKMESAYADIVTQGDVAQAKRELRLHLREHVVWERNTVWREMIGIERKAQAANMGFRRTLLGGDNDPLHARLQGDDEQTGDMKELKTPVGRIRCPRWLFSSTMFTLVGIITVFIVMLLVPIMEKEEQQNCLALVVFVSLLWATEVSAPLSLLLA